MVTGSIRMMQMDILHTHTDTHTVSTWGTSSPLCTRYVKSSSLSSSKKRCCHSLQWGYWLYFSTKCCFIWTKSIRPRAAVILTSSSLKCATSYTLNISSESLKVPPVLLQVFDLSSTWTLTSFLRRSCTWGHPRSQTKSGCATEQRSVSSL